MNEPDVAEVRRKAAEDCESGDKFCALEPVCAPCFARRLLRITPATLHEVRAAIGSAMAGLRVDDTGGAFYSAKEHRDNALAQLRWAARTLDDLIALDSLEPA